jgi:hypothetical protein
MNHWMRFHPILGLVLSKNDGTVCFISEGMNMSDDEAMKEGLRKIMQSYDSDAAETAAKLLHSLGEPYLDARTRARSRYHIVTDLDEALSKFRDTDFWFANFCDGEGWGLKNGGGLYAYIDDALLERMLDEGYLWLDPSTPYVKHYFTTPKASAYLEAKEYARLRQRYEQVNQ